MIDEMYFDRRVHDALLDVLKQGPAQELVQLARGQQPRHDLQLRADRKKPHDSRATLYAGDTAVLQLHYHAPSPRKHEYFKLDAHEKHTDLAPTVPWQQQLTSDELASAWPSVSAYLTVVDDSDIVTKAMSMEGAVHVGIASGTSDAYRVVQREAVPGFRNTKVKTGRKEAWRKPFAKAMDGADDGRKWWPRSSKWSVGTKLDFLAVDIGGRLLAMEAKHHAATASEVAKVAIQTGTYAAMFADLLAEQSDAIDVIEQMLAQRAELGLTRPGTMHLRNAGIVVPVIAIGPDRPSAEVHRRMWQVAHVVDDARAAGRNVDPLEVWYLDDHGRVLEVERAEDVEL